MLEPTQIVQVFAISVAAVLSLWALSLIGVFIITHIVPIGLLVLAASAVGVWIVAGHGRSQVN